jgi:hypothetical protein
MIATIEIVRLLSQSFLRNALTAGVAISLLSGLVGYFVVLRATPPSPAPWPLWLPESSHDLDCSSRQSASR